jgi:hypothetical protein
MDDTLLADGWSHRPDSARATGRPRTLGPAMAHPGASAIPTHPSDYACIDLANRAFSDYRGTGPAVDRITSRQWQQWFLRRHGLAPRGAPPPPVDELARLRGDLRRVLERWSSHGALSRRDVRTLDAWVRDVPMRRRVVGDDGLVGLLAEPAERDWAWVAAAVAASAVDLMAAGDPDRLRTCGNPSCSWLFYDDTLNGSKRFCSTTPCGSLIRVRRFRKAH